MKIYIETLGCPKNMVDSENMAGALEEAGHRITKDPGEAGAIIVNTCGFIDDAKKESIETILDMAAWKLGEESSTSPKLIVTGCLSERYQDDLYQQLPEVDLFLGVNEYHLLPQLLEKPEFQEKKVFLGAEDTYVESPSRRSKADGYSAYLKIAEGCDNFCAYCAIPAIRGAYRSRQMDQILEEAERLVKQGVKELILVAQDVTAYGIDLYGNYCLPELLRKLCKLEHGPEWIRLMYCYEERITDELIQVMAEEPKICHYIDIPIQHYSDQILSAMNRRSTSTSIQDTLDRLRNAIPDIHIRSTLITGFPGETRDDFQQLLQFVERNQFDRLGVFAYSKEEGTPAAAMKQQIPKATKERRRDKIMALQQKISLENNRKKIGTILQILVEEQEEDGSYWGRSRFDAPEIDQTVLFTSKRKIKPGTMVQVRILDAFDYDLTGEETDEYTQ